MNRGSRRIWFAVSLVVIQVVAGLLSTVHAADGNLFLDVVQPLLQAKCVSCHGPEQQEGGLRLDSYAAATFGGDRGPAIVPEDVAASLLIQAVTFKDPELQMPPKQRLSEEDIAALTEWVKTGAVWPAPVAVLFEDQPQLLAALTSGNGTGRLVSDKPYQGHVALGITPLQRDAVAIPGWQFAIREQPQPGEYRYLRLAWKKQGPGSVMVELALNGNWPAAKSAQGRYVAGTNSTGWAAISLSEHAPVDWEVVTCDLWQDIGDFTLTGIAPTCDGGDEAFFDSIMLGPTIESLDAYLPGAELPNIADLDNPVGDAFTDKRNPIRRLFRGTRLDLWSLQKPTPGAVTAVTDNLADEGVIDRLIQQRLTQAQLALSPEADRRTLIRRLTLDLTGLPPTPEEIADYLEDESPHAYDRLVDRLLASPRYGERQARLWLDVVRYADTNGYERDEFRPLAWQYRDYVVRAFNQDKPFHEFIREQLAGDELVDGPPESRAEADMLIATGYLRLGQWDSTASIFQEEERLRAEQLADLTNTTASAFLGLTMSCCQCHDHKYDPFSQADHFRLRAFFAGVTPRDDLAISLADEQAKINAHNAALEEQLAPLNAALAVLDKDHAEDQPRHAELTAQIAELEGQRRAFALTMGATDAGETAPATHVFYQGDFSAPREVVAPGFASVLTPAAAEIPAVRNTTTGRRLALANWIASTENPWTARVLVNRIWQQHFGIGLVATPNDFGYSGGRPTHPELLDWLALEFMQRDWSVKALHRLIVTSNTYRQASLETAAGRSIDPDNQLLWRQNVQRLDAETLRDSLLFTAGLLQPYAAGRPLWPPVPLELRSAQPAILEAEKGDDGGRMQGWYADPVEQTDVRSLFLVRKRCLPIPFLQAFDLPDTTVSCARRDTTVVAPQALMLLNSPEGIRYAQALAMRVGGTDFGTAMNEPQPMQDVISQLFQVTLNRHPTGDELAMASEFLRRHQTLHQEAGEQASLRALTDLCRAILNLNEFAYVD